jgi:hypothetical protein
MNAIRIERQADLRNSIAYILETEGKMSKIDAGRSAILLTQMAREFGLDGSYSLCRLAALSARYFGGFGGRPPLPRAALRVLYRRTPDSVQKLDELEELGKSATAAMLRRD